MSPTLENLCTHCIHGLAMGLTPLCVTYMQFHLFFLSLYLMDSVKLDISHLNINLLSAPASLTVFHKTRSNQKFARFRG